MAGAERHRRLPGASITRAGLPDSSDLSLRWSLYWGKLAGPNPWGGTTLEWQTASPPPPENFHVTPVVTTRPSTFMSRSRPLSTLSKDYWPNHFDSLEQQHEVGVVAHVDFFGHRRSSSSAGSSRRTPSTVLSYFDAFVVGSKATEARCHFGHYQYDGALGQQLDHGACRPRCSNGQEISRKLILVATILLGAVFLGIKAVEWHHDYVEGMVPGLSWDSHKWQEEEVAPKEVQIFFLLYFCMTGLHALHMLVGFGILGYMLWCTRRGMFTPEYYAPIEITGLYWHFVDIVWIFLFPLLYLIRH